MDLKNVPGLMGIEGDLGPENFKGKVIILAGLSPGHYKKGQ